MRCVFGLGNIEWNKFNIDIDYLILTKAEYFWSGLIEYLEEKKNYIYYQEGHHFLIKPVIPEFLSLQIKEECKGIKKRFAPIYFKGIFIQQSGWK